MKFSDIVLKNPKKIIVAVVIITLVCAVLASFVPVNYNIDDYMDKNASSTISIQVLNEAFPGGVPNARLMVPGLNMAEALELKEKIAAIDGVKEITWIDNLSPTEVPLEYLGEEVSSKYYSDGNVLYTLTLQSHDVVPAVRATAEEYVQTHTPMSGLKVSSSYSNQTMWQDIKIIMLIAVPIIGIILLITTSSIIEPILFVIAIGAAIIMNMGTNIIFGEISYITSGIAALLQLAISIDYAIFLMHRFDEYRREGMEVKEAMALAMKKSFASVWSSGITAAIGFVALVAMRLQIGPDIGWVMVKGIFISLICVFTFLPAMVIVCNKLIDRTRHRAFLPSFRGFAKFAKKAAIPCLIVVAIILVPSVIAVENNSYKYFDMYSDSNTSMGKDMKAISDEFGQFSQMILMVPDGNAPNESALLTEIESIPVISSVVSYGKTVSAEVPKEYVPPDTLKKLVGNGLTRYIITADTSTETPEAFDACERIRASAELYYPGQWYLAGEIPTSYDLKNEVLEDDLVIILISVGGILLVLLLVFRSVIIPPILVIVIESAIFINCAIPYFAGDPMFYITRMVVFAVQLGATVDFSILIASRYAEYRREHNRKESIQKTLENASISVLTSATILATAGFLMACISSDPLLSEIGLFIGRGSILSIVTVLFVLPALLLLLDKVIQKLSLKMKFAPDTMNLREVLKS